MASLSEGEVDRKARLAMFAGRGKGGVSKHSELSQLRTSRMRIEESHRLGCIQVLEKMSQLDLEEFQVLCQNLSCGGDSKGQVRPGPSGKPK